MAVAEKAPKVIDVKAAEAPWYRKWLPLIGVGLIVLYCLLPFFWMVVSSLRRPTDQFENTIIPSPVSLTNFSDVFKPGTGFGRALLNSLIVAGTVTILTLIIGMVAAYTLARLEFRGKNFVLAIIIVTSMFPGISLVIPLKKLFSDIEWINTYQAMIVPSLSFALPLAVWLLTAFFRQMPRELEQAAMVDGCTPAQAFRKVILPLAAPGVFTTAIITFIAAWN
jgi:multiple sugar transport system permease protein